jgi:hypothetical protein
VTSLPRDDTDPFEVTQTDNGPTQEVEVAPEDGAYPFVSAEVAETCAVYRAAEPDVGPTCQPHMFFCILLPPVSTKSRLPSPASAAHAQDAPTRCRVSLAAYVGRAEAEIEHRQAKRRHGAVALPDFREGRCYPHTSPNEVEDSISSASLSMFASQKESTLGSTNRHHCPFTSQPPADIANGRGLVPMPRPCSPTLPSI